MKKIKIGIIGHTGRLGKPLHEILQGHPHAKVVHTFSRGEGRTGEISDIDVVFLALPYGQSKKYLGFLDWHIEGKRIIDLGVDHRFQEGWTYGLPELYRDGIANAQRVANPGCYATSIILGLAPLKGEISDVVVASLSGISGAGEMRTGQDNFRPYMEKQDHPQIREMTYALGGRITFTPVVSENTDRGIVSVITGNVSKGINITRRYDAMYSGEPFVRLINGEEPVETKNVIGTNYCDIKVIQIGPQVKIMTALDNILKGGALQAVQNFNIMYGLDETVGLQPKH